jgi:hypothetical protein
MKLSSAFYLSPTVFAIQFDSMSPRPRLKKVTILPPLMMILIGRPSGRQSTAIVPGALVGSRAGELLIKKNEEFDSKS